MTGSSLVEGLWRRGFPLLVVTAAVLILWYGGAIWLNTPQVREHLATAGNAAPDFRTVVEGCFTMTRPVLPTPDQIAVEVWTSITGYPLGDIHNLLYHAWVSGESALLGFVLGSLFGALLAVGIVHSRTLDGSLMPWIVASQTVPILAIAPMIVVVLGSIGLVGLVPKAIISMYLCFFPVTIGMVKGLRSADTLAKDLMRTYSATPAQVFWKLRMPAAMPFLFASLKVAIAIALIGAIVGELPTGSQAGLGSRLLAGSYYGQTTQIWAALVVASVLSVVLVFLIARAERIFVKRAGGR